MESESVVHKTHRQPQAGPKARKKKDKTKHEQELTDRQRTDRQRNPKAFAVQSVNRAARTVRRAADIKEKKHHIPVVDRTPLEPPPYIVAVVGPPKVGKSTLIRCLVKNFTRQNLNAIQGPVTLVSGKKRRLTFIECNNDINSMIDLAKVADLVLLLVDASFGFEMETFEFLNITQIHGFPRIMGVLTHLDLMRNNKALKKTKKRLKHRFWTEIYQGAKLFYLSGMVFGDYQKREIHNLGRFISVMKFRPLTWRTTHPYILADRMEDLTEPELCRQDPKCDRTISLYGYVRGTPMKNGSSIHIPGCGDFPVKDISFLPDPCPLPDKEKKRSLNEKERLIYAPLSGVGGIIYDKDVVYIDLGSNKPHSETVQEEEQPTHELVSNLIGTQNTLDSKMAASKLSIFQDSSPLTSEQVSQDPQFSMPGEEVVSGNDGRIRRKAVFKDEDNREDEGSEGEDDDSEAEEEEEISDDDEGPAAKETQKWSLEKRTSVGDRRTAKKQKMDLGDVAFADSDDDLELSQVKTRTSIRAKQSEKSGRQGEVQTEGDVKTKRRTKKDEAEEDESSTSEEDSEEGEMEVTDDRSEKTNNRTKKAVKETSDAEEDQIELSTRKDVKSKKRKGRKKEDDAGVEETATSEEEESDDNSDEEDSSDEEEEEDKADDSNKSEDDKDINEYAKEFSLRQKQLRKSKMSSLLKLEAQGLQEDLSKSKRTKKSSVVSDEPERTSKEKSTKVVKFDAHEWSEKSEESGEEEDIEEEEENDSDDDHGDDIDQMNGDETVNTESAGKDSLFGTGYLKWKDNLAKKAADAFLKRQSDTPNLRKLVYGNVAEANSSDEDESKDNVGGLFKVIKPTKDEKKKLRRGMNDLDCSSFPVEHVRDWALDEVHNLISDCFVTGKWEAGEDAKTLLDQDDELYGDFVDLETGEVHHGKGSQSDEDEDKSDDDMDEEEGGESEDKMGERKEEKTDKEKRLEKKRKLKEMFDADYDDQDEGTYFDDLKQQMEEQAKLNRAEFEDMDESVRTQYEGFRPGMYVRVEIAKVPCEFVLNFDPTYPIILGGLLHSEDTIGYVQIRLKKHRWYGRILKTRDPLIFSLGWRRFQTIPLYSIQDHNGRHRLLKYTPEHMHCTATIWGPITPQGTGILAVQSVSGRQPGFRISATGVILDLDKSINIVKKLKLTGTPFKIHKHTAFIKGMFNSQLEVAKFEGASIRSVSGIRGQVKKARRTPEGAYRATFEDKLLMSDIVFIRTWYRVDIPKFYNPVTTLLLPKDNKDNWSGMRTVGQMRREMGMSAPKVADSSYKTIERAPRRFNPLHIPKDLQRALPFKDKPKAGPKKKRRGGAGKNLRAVVLEPKEKKVASLMHELSTLYKEKQRKERMAMAKRVDAHRKIVSAQQDKLLARQKKDKGELFRLLGQMQQKKQKRMSKGK